MKTMFVLLLLLSCGKSNAKKDEIPPVVPAPTQTKYVVFVGDERIECAERSAKNGSALYLGQCSGGVKEVLNATNVLVIEE